MEQCFSIHEQREFIPLFIEGSLFLRITGEYGLERLSWTGFNYTLDSCLAQGHCPNSIETLDAFEDHFLTLSPGVLTDTISSIPTTFKETAIFYDSYPSQTDAKGEFLNYKSHQAEARQRKHIVLLFIYLVMALMLVLLNHFKKRLGIDYQFKFSKLSKLMLRYLTVKSLLIHRQMLLAIVVSVLDALALVKWNIFRSQNDKPSLLIN